MTALEQLLDDTGQPGLPELRAVLGDVLQVANGGVLVVEQLELKPCVHRIVLETGGDLRRLVVKRLRPDIAQRNELVARSWLPAEKLEQHGPALVAVAAERGGGSVWHVYEDLGEVSLAGADVERAHVEAAVDLIAKLHARFVRHSLLPEIRLWGGDLGAAFFEASVRDSANALEALSLGEPAVRLLERLHGLLAETPDRVRLLAEAGGPETFLHGDLWTTNALVLPADRGFLVRLIDWDHAAVGPVTYDLSTFLGRFPGSERAWILERYREQLGTELPSDEALNHVFETCETARLANGVIWPALAASRGETAWALERLAELDQWFDELEPLLP